MTAGERDQAPDWLGYGGHDVPHVELHDLVPVAATGIRNVDAHLYLLAVLQGRQGEAGGRKPRVRMTEGGVAAAVAEVELRAEF